MNWIGCFSLWVLVAIKSAIIEEPRLLTRLFKSSGTKKLRGDIKEFFKDYVETKLVKYLFVLKGKSISLNLIDVELKTFPNLLRLLYPLWCKL